MPKQKRTRSTRIEKPEEPKSFRIKLRPKLSLHIDVADDGERDKVVGNCVGSNPASPPKNDPAKIPTRITDHRTGEVTDHPQRERSRSWHSLRSRSQHPTQPWQPSEMA